MYFLVNKKKALQMYCRGTSGLDCAGLLVFALSLDSTTLRSQWPFHWLSYCMTLPCPTLTSASNFCHNFFIHCPLKNLFLFVSSYIGNIFKSISFLTFCPILNPKS